MAMDCPKKSLNLGDIFLLSAETTERKKQHPLGSAFLKSELLSA
jgi:hypothetical protein